MLRQLLAGALALGLATSAGLSGTNAQEKKEPPKKKERIAIAEPKDAAKDPDFATRQYEGKEPDRRPRSAPVIAKGKGSSQSGF